MRILLAAHSSEICWGLLPKRILFLEYQNAFTFLDLLSKNFFWNRAYCSILCQPLRFFLCHAQIFLCLVCLRALHGDYSRSGVCNHCLTLLTFKTNCNSITNYSLYKMFQHWYERYLKDWEQSDALAFFPSCWTHSAQIQFSYGCNDLLIFWLEHLFCALSTSSKVNELC